MVHLPTTFAAISKEQLLFDQLSPIEKLSRLSAHLTQSKESDTLATKFWIKREDCNSGLAFGGNKVRKLEYVIADALKSGCDTLVTTGGIQSNHMRQTAAVASRYGLKVFARCVMRVAREAYSLQIILAPRDAVPDRPHEYHELGNVQLNSLLSADTHAMGQSMDEVAADVQRAGGTPYVIPSGASTHPLGGLGFARCAFEIIEQEHALGVHFDTIVVASASGSTLGGLIAGFALAGQEDEVEKASSRALVGVDAFAAPEGQTEGLVLSIARNTAKLIGVRDEIAEHSFTLDRKYNAGSYGKLNPATVEGIKFLAQTEGILLDPVYTGKAFTGLLDKARRGELRDSRNVLFMHTGGQPSLSAYPELK